MIVLPKYPETGVSDPYVAPAAIVSDVPSEVAVAPEPPPLKIRVAVVAPITVPAPMTILTSLIETRVQEAAVEFTVAVQLFSGAGSKKFDPNNETADPIYAVVGFVSDMFGGDKITSKLEFARAPNPPLFIEISTKAYP